MPIASQQEYHQKFLEAFLTKLAYRAGLAAGQKSGVAGNVPLEQATGEDALRLFSFLDARNERIFIGMRIPNAADALPTFEFFYDNSQGLITKLSSIESQNGKFKKGAINAIKNLLFAADKEGIDSIVEEMTHLNGEPRSLNYSLYELKSYQTTQGYFDDFREISASKPPKGFQVEDAFMPYFKLQLDKKQKIDAAFKRAAKTIFEVNPLLTRQGWFDLNLGGGLVDQNLQIKNISDGNYEICDERGAIVSDEAKNEQVKKAVLNHLVNLYEACHLIEYPSLDSLMKKMPEILESFGEESAKLTRGFEEAVREIKTLKKPDGSVDEERLENIRNFVASTKNKFLLGTGINPLHVEQLGFLEFEPKKEAIFESFGNILAKTPQGLAIMRDNGSPQDEGSFKSFLASVAIAEEAANRTFVAVDNVSNSELTTKALIAAICQNSPLTIGDSGKKIFEQFGLKIELSEFMPDGQSPSSAASQNSSKTAKVSFASSSLSHVEITFGGVDLENGSVLAKIAGQNADQSQHVMIFKQLLGKAAGIEMDAGPSAATLSAEDEQLRQVIAESKRLAAQEETQRNRTEEGELKRAIEISQSNVGGFQGTAIGGNTWATVVQPPKAVPPVLLSASGAAFLQRADLPQEFGKLMTALKPHLMKIHEDPNFCLKNESYLLDSNQSGNNPTLTWLKQPTSGSREFALNAGGAEIKFHLPVVIAHGCDESQSDKELLGVLIQSAMEVKIQEQIDNLVVNFREQMRIDKAASADHGLQVRISSRTSNNGSMIQYGLGDVQPMLTAIASAKKAIEGAKNSDKAGLAAGNQPAQAARAAAGGGGAAAGVSAGSGGGNGHAATSVMSPRPFEPSDGTTVGDVGLKNTSDQEEGAGRQMYGRPFLRRTGTGVGIAGVQGWEERVQNLGEKQRSDLLAAHLKRPTNSDLDPTKQSSGASQPELAAKNAGNNLVSATFAFDDAQNRSSKNENGGAIVISSSPLANSTLASATAATATASFEFDTDNSVRTRVVGLDPASSLRPAAAAQAPNQTPQPSPSPASVIRQDAEQREVRSHTLVRGLKGLANVFGRKSIFGFGKKGGNARS